MIKKIDRSKCDICELRIKDTCPIMESCFQDVIRLDEERRPYIKYGRDCCTCWLYWKACQADCPLGAVEVSGLVPLYALKF